MSNQLGYILRLCLKNKKGEKWDFCAMKIAAEGATVKKQSALPTVRVLVLLMQPP